MIAESKKKELVEFCLKNGVLVSNDLLVRLEEGSSVELIKEILAKVGSKDILILNKDVAELFSVAPKDVNWAGFEESRAFSEKGKQSGYGKFLEFISNGSSHEEDYPVKVVFSYNPELKKWSPDDFTNYFNARFNAIERMLRKRQELVNLISINRLINKHEKEAVSLIGMVQSKEFTKNRNLVLTLEDTTGRIKVIVNKNKSGLFEDALGIVHDEVIAVSGVTSNGVVFVNNILWPDVPDNGYKKCNEECYAVFISDLHLGSRHFLDEDFMRFLRWLNCEIGDEKQISIAEKVGYVFVLGDVVDGCGIYPGQEDDLLIKDVRQQYEECARLLAMIPKRIKIIVCPGNHDAMRLAEPQLPIYREFAEALYNLPNLIMVSNPAMVNIHAKECEGLNVLIYHGFSFDYYVANVEHIRSNGGYERVGEVMKFLLRRRHLAPTHSSTLYIPDSQMDPLVIENLPDIFATGHIHKTSITNFRGITLIGGSCWQSITDYQKKRGHVPEPARAAVVNLLTRQARIIKFGR